MGLLMEIAKWPPENRQGLVDFTLWLMKEREKTDEPARGVQSQVATVHTKDFKPGVQQIWWDLTYNRSFTLIYGDPGLNTAMGLYKHYEPAIEICDVQTFDLMEVRDAYGMLGVNPDGYKPPRDLPRIQMELATWSPQNRQKMLEMTADMIKRESKKGPFPVGADILSVHNPGFQKGIHQIWWPANINLSFCLLYDYPWCETQELFWHEYHNVCKVFDAVLCNVIEIRDAIKFAGLK